LGRGQRRVHTHRHILVQVVTIRASRIHNVEFGLLLDSGDSNHHVGFVRGFLHTRISRALIEELPVAAGFAVDEVVDEPVLIRIKIYLQREKARTGSLAMN
jgi:hypothetical protein